MVPLPFGVWDMNRSIQIFRRIITPLVVALVAFGLFAPAASAANTAVIAGTVRAAETGDPLPGATVSVYLTPNVTTPVATTTSAVDGSYQVGSLAAGTYKIRFSADATTFVQSWYWFADTAADATAVSFAEGDQVNWVDGYLTDATTSVAGTVYDSDGATGGAGRHRRPVLHRGSGPSGVHHADRGRRYLPVRGGDARRLPGPLHPGHRPAGRALVLVRRQRRRCSADHHRRG